MTSRIRRLSGRARRIAATGAALLALVAAAPSARADHDHDHWHDRTVVVRDETGFADHRRALTLAVQQWNAAGASIRLVVADGRGRGCAAPEPGEIAVCRADLGASRAGEARVWRSGEHIVRASVLIHAGSWRYEHLVAIACHELGHAVGLDHRAERTSCLTASIHSSQPDDHDRAALRRAHAHAEPTAPETETETEVRCPLLRLGDSCLL